MISRFFFPVLVLFLFCACGNKENATDPKAKADTAKPKQKAKEKEGLIYPYEIIKPKKNPYDDASIRIGDTVVFCSYKGEIDYVHPAGSPRNKIVHIHCEYLIERVFILPREDSRWFIAWQETDQKGQRTTLAVYKAGEKKPDWKISFPYTNTGPPVVDGDMCYFTTMGMVGKVDISTGEMKWKVDSLFNPAKWTYKRFYVPKVYPNKVVFVDMPERGRREKLDTLILDPETGKRKVKK
jgi:hypothetical protein